MPTTSGPAPCTPKPSAPTASCPEIIGRLLDRHDVRRAARRQTWREHSTAERAFYERYQRLAADIGRAADRGMDRGYGFEL